MKKNVAIVTGGNSNEREISIQSAKTILEFLNKDLYNLFLIDIKSNIWTYTDSKNQSFRINLNDFSLSLNNNKIFFDGVFIAIHGKLGEDGQIQAYFDLLKIPYTSSGILASALTFDKIKTNYILKSKGFINATFKHFNSSKVINYNSIIKELNLPLVVKPSKNGSSYGISIVKNEDELKNAIDFAFKFDNEILIEEYIKGVEVSCSVYNFDGKTKTLPITEIIPKGIFFDYDAKYKGHSEEITPARISKYSAREISKITIQVYDFLNLKGAARIDYIIKESNQKPYLIEVNTIPGVTKSSILPQQIKSLNWNLEDFFNDWIKNIF